MRHALAAFAVACLSACGTPDQIDPGLWAITTEITEFASLPGVEPPEVVLREPAPFTRVACLTAAQATKPELADLIGAGGFGCNDRVTMEKGRISASRQGCTSSGLPEFVAGRMRTLEGAFDARTFELRGRSSEMSTEGNRLFTAARFTARRLGECIAPNAPAPSRSSADASVGRNSTAGLEPGLWRVMVTTVDRYPRQSSPDTPYARLYCLDRTRLARPGNLFLPPVGGTQCSETVAAAAGRIVGRRICRFPDLPIEQEMVEELAGRFGPASFRARASSRTRVTVENPDTGASRTEEPSRIVHFLAGQRLGDC
ncbi:MAG TPA: DUF3617 family protein [Allosphingosinicella sp.]